MEIQGHQEVLRMLDSLKKEDGKPLVLYVKAMNGTERVLWANVAYDEKGNLIEQGLQARLLVHCLVDKDGKRIFTDADIDELDKHHGGVLNRLNYLAKDINKLGAASVDDAEKNSETSPS